MVLILGQDRSEMHQLVIYNMLLKVPNYPQGILYQLVYTVY